MSDTLPCTKCHRDLPRSAFGRNAIAKTRGGLSYQCLECRREHSRQDAQHLRDLKAARKDGKA